MSSRRSGKRWGNQSKYQPSRAGKQEALNRVLAKYKKAKPQLSINIGKAEQVAGNIGSYRKSKSATSFVATNKVLQNLKSKGLSEDNPTYKSLFRTIAPKGFREHCTSYAIFLGMHCQPRMSYRRPSLKTYTRQSRAEKGQGAGNRCSCH